MCCSFIVYEMYIFVVVSIWIIHKNGNWHDHYALFGKKNKTKQNKNKTTHFRKALNTLCLGRSNPNSGIGIAKRCLINTFNPSMDKWLHQL